MDGENQAMCLHQVLHEAQNIRHRNLMLRGSFGGYSLSQTVVIKW
jgi:hypothetical protein